MWFHRESSLPFFLFFFPLLTTVSLSLSLFLSLSIYIYRGKFIAETGKRVNNVNSESKENWNISIQR